MKIPAWLPRPKGSTERPEAEPAVAADGTTAVPKPRRHKEPRVAFVLSGGGNLGSVQVGMMRALAERSIRPDVVLGCSVGALNGAAYAADPTLAGVRRMEAQWREVTGDKLMPTGRMPSMVQLLRKGEAVSSNEGLRSLVGTFLGDRQTFESLKIRFECVATDLVSGVARWFGSGELLDPILASAALPAVYPPVTLEGRRYVDGGVIDNVPISRAVELGAERVYVLHVGLHGRPEATIRRPVDGAMLGYWIARNHRFMRDLSNIPNGTQVVILPTGTRPELRYDDFSRTEELIQVGYQRAAEFLDGDEFASLPKPSRWLGRLGLGRPGVVIGPRLPADALLPGPGDGAAFEDDAELTAALKLVEAASPHPGDA
ncbi:MAG: patatin-like phospholipase family protein [Candidatus Microthrix subdominans]|jgi:NTE family protein|nr:patatin-like phospholipase family protein [Candidatus Microthrix sp.]MBK6312586.1 patatin-like phospholipase family protein [Candidatus Microthrix sp.]MBK6439663.1 patatin-like phospholipase family protein [Candidatus Microthrix sp.]MBK6969562.1 patatin-like phospholipase family protein [Candidatus Microthrix sp.]MBK7164960.1 patatin-like phospholipase family protein [Candidatus Microthrix sp.]MBK9560446.1 patatin-like phospholipase family protein [Candidatus Microthrix sp.]